MEKKRKKFSLRTKIFMLSFLLVLAAVVIFATLGLIQFGRFANIIVDSNIEQERIISEATTNTMEERAKRNFVKYVQLAAEIINGEFWSMENDTELLAECVNDVLTHPENYNEAVIYEPDDHPKDGVSCQLLFSSDECRDDTEMLEEVGRLANLQSFMVRMVNKEDYLSDMLISLPGGATIIADEHPGEKVDSDGKPLFFDGTRRPYYVGAYLKQDSYFAPANYDYFNNTMEIMVGVPVYVDGELKAVCSSSRELSDIEDIVGGMDLSSESYLCLINETGNIVYSQWEDGELCAEDVKGGSVLNSSNIELVRFVEDALAGSNGYEKVTINGEPTYIAYASVESVGWTVLLGIAQESLEEPANALVAQMDSTGEETLNKTRRMAGQVQYMIYGAALLLILIAVIATLRHSRRIVKPVVQLKDAGRMFIEREDAVLTEGSDYFDALKLYTGDEIEDLWKTMRELENNITLSARSLEKVTAEKERIDTELSVATRIQSDMLPGEFPAFPDRYEFDLYSSMTPAKEVGGDFYDFFLIDEDHLALVMADVSGKGVPAALFMVVTKTLIKNMALSGRCKGPGEILHEVNNELCKNNDEMMFVTVWLGIVTISTGQLISANGGHEYPAICRKGERFSLIEDKHGPGLGTFEDVGFEEWKGEVLPGDLLFLYTDGLPETTDEAHEMLGIEGMTEALDESVRAIKEMGDNENRLKEMLTHIKIRADEFKGEAPQFDDLTMTIFEYKGKKD